MFRYSKQITLLFALLFISTVCLENVYAKGGRSSSSSRSSSRSSFSSSKSKYSSPSSKSSSSKYSSPSSKPSTGSSKYSSPSSKPSGTASTNAARPPTSTTSKSSANQAATSKRTFEETKKATLPPKTSYKTSDGKEVKVRTDSSHVKTIRSRPSTDYTPEARQNRTTNHIHHYHYSHDYGWYNSQPSVFIGGGYSSPFWWMMSEWSAERRAMWLYHNRNNIENSAYQRGLQDATVAAQIQKLESEKVTRNSDYVDPEFKDNPDIMYSQEYVEAAYNPVSAPSKGGYVLTILLATIIIVVVGYSLYLFVTKIRFGN